MLLLPLSRFGRLVDLLVDRRDPLDPERPLAVLQRQHFITRPVEVVGDVGYLLVEPLERVADYPPTGLTSISK